MSAAAFNLKKWVKKLVLEAKNGLDEAIFILTDIIRGQIFINLVFSTFSHRSHHADCQRRRWV